MIHALEIIKFLFGLGFFTIFLKYLALPHYRRVIGRQGFEENRPHLDKLYDNYENKNSKHPAQLQSDTDIYLGHNKISYQFMFLLLQKDEAYIDEITKDYLYAQYFIFEKTSGHDIKLRYRYSSKTLKAIDQLTFILILLGSTFYLGWLVFDLISGDNSYTAFTAPILSLVLLIILLASLTGSKAITALSLGKKIPIAEPNDPE